jgi:hypothetical protein
MTDSGSLENALGKSTIFHETLVQAVTHAMFAPEETLMAQLGISSFVFHTSCILLVAAEALDIGLETA